MIHEIEERPSAEERMALIPTAPALDVEEGRRWRRLVIIALMLAGVAIATSFIVAAFALGGQQEAEQRASSNATVAADAKQQAGAAAAAAEEANRRLRAAGKPTVPIPTVVVSVPVQSTGLTSDQIASVRSIISSELEGYRLPTAAVSQIATAAAALVPKPKDGHTPTVAELKPLAAAAQLAYCVGGKCTPKPGKDGTPGRDGTAGVPGSNGTPGRDGADAPAVTNEQLQPIVAEGIASYCAGDKKPCDGSPGTQGEQGEPGRGISNMICPPDDNDLLTEQAWIIRWTREPLQTEGGVCRAAGIP